MTGWQTSNLDIRQRGECCRTELTFNIYSQHLLSQLAYPGPRESENVIKVSETIFYFYCSAELLDQVSFSAADDHLIALCC